MKKLFFYCATLLFFHYTYANDPSIETIHTYKNYIQQEIGYIEGWCSKEKALAMFDLIIQENPNICVEIGVWGGSSIFPTALALKLLCNGGIVFAIDPWETEECIKHYTQGDPNFEWWSKVNIQKIYSSYVTMLNKFDIVSQCITYKETSASAYEKIPYDIDILHIDGNHSEESSFFDIVTYYPKVKSGGYIWFDDKNWTSTKKAIDYLYEHCTCVQMVDNGNCILFKKP